MHRPDGLHNQGKDRLRRAALRQTDPANKFPARHPLARLFLLKTAACQSTAAVPRAVPFGSSQAGGNAEPIFASRTLDKTEKEDALPRSVPVLQQIHA